MNASDPFLALFGTVVIFTAVLFFFSCIPWYLAAALYKANIAPPDVKALAVRTTVLVAFILWIMLLFQPGVVRRIPFLADAVADPFLSELPPQTTIILQVLLSAECIVLLVCPVFLVTILLAITLYFIVLAPPLSLLTRLLAQSVGAINIRTTRRREARAQRNRQATVARMEHERRQSEQATQRSDQEQKREHLRQTVHHLAETLRAARK